MADLEKDSNKNRNELFIERCTAKMEQVLDKHIDALCQGFQQELNSKATDKLRSKGSSTTMTTNDGKDLFYTRCFVQGNICSVKIDERNCNNVASEFMVQKLGLKVKQHQWFDDKYNLRVSPQVTVSIRIGKYEDEILCDVQPMESCHILLGRPWQSDRKVMHDSFTNRHKFTFKGRKTVLLPMTPHEVQQDLLTLKQRQIESNLMSPLDLQQKEICPNQLTLDSNNQEATEVAKFVEQSGHEEVIAVQENLQSALTVEEENHEKNEQPECAVQEPESKKSEEGDSEEKQIGGNITEAVPKKPCTKKIEENHGVIYSMMIKEKKPDSPQFFSIKNGTVSRTKLYQEEGYDMIMESSEKTSVPCSAQTKSMINFSIPSATWSTFSPHLEHTSKLNHSNPSSGEEVIQLPSQVIPSLRESDIRAFNNYFQPNQKESSYETNYSGILVHHRVWENCIHHNAGSDLGDMNFTSQWICFRPYCATEPKIMMHRPTKVRSRRKTNWIILLDLLGFQQAQEQKKWISDHKVIAHFPKWVNLVLYLKNSKSSPFKSLQNHVWHPGGISTKPSKPSKRKSRLKKQGEANNNNSSFEAEVIKTSSLSFMQI